LRSWPRLLWPYLLLAVLAVGFCSRALLGGKALLPLDLTLRMAPWRCYAQERFPGFERVANPMLDPIQQYYPWRHYAVSQLQAGRLPLWNPHAFSGTPFLANLQSALFYPPNLLFLVMPLWLAFTLGAALHLFLAGACMYGLCRAWHLSPWPALLGATAYMLNGFTVAWLEYPAFGLWVVAWLPLALLVADKMIERPSLRGLGMLSLVVAGQLLGGQLQLATYLLLALGGYALARSLAARRLRPLGYTLAAAALGALIACGQLLPTLELAPRSHRPPGTLQGLRSCALPWTHLATLAVPSLFGNPADYNYWGSAPFFGRPGINFPETSGYAGVVTLALAPLALPWWRRRPQVAYLAALWLVAMLLAMGTPLYLLLYYLVPGFKQLAGLARVLFLGAFALSGLGALGAERLLAERAARAWPSALAGVGVLAFAAGVCWWFEPTVRLAWPDYGSYSWVQVGIGAGLVAVLLAALALRSRLAPAHLGAMLAALVALDMFVAGFRFNPATDPRMAYFPTPGTRALATQPGRLLCQGSDFLNWMPPNTPTVFGLRDVQGSDSLWWGRYLQLLRVAEPEAPTFHWRRLESRVLDLLAVRSLASTVPVDSADWTLQAQPDLLIYRHHTALPEAFTVGRWQQLPERQVLARLDAPSWEPRQQALLLAPVPGAQPGGPGRAQAISRPDPQHVRVRVRETRPRAVLVVSEPAYPGWRLRLDGRPAPVLVTNYLFLGAVVPSGEHLVEFEYRPASFRLGLFLGLAGMALALGLLVAGKERRDE